NEPPGFSSLRNGIELMKKALGDDLRAALPSRDPVQLRATLTELGKLHIATTLDDMMTRLLRLVDPSRQIDVYALLGRLVDIIGSPWVSRAQFEAMVKDLKIQGTQKIINFLTEVKKIMRELPTSIYSDSNARDAVATAAQDALDAAIEEENDMGDD